MKSIGLGMVIGMVLAAPVFANTPTGQMSPGTSANQDILPETNTREGDGSGLGISDPLPPDVDNLNMGESGASGAVGTATGTTTNPRFDERNMDRNMGRRGIKTNTATNTSTTTSTGTNTNTGQYNY